MLSASVITDWFWCSQSVQLSGWSFSPPAGLLGCCCGKSSRWDSCRILVKPTKRCWSLSPAEAEWILPRAVPGLCEYLQGTHRNNCRVEPDDFRDSQKKWKIWLCMQLLICNWFEFCGFLCFLCFGNLMVQLKQYIWNVCLFLWL